MSNPKKSVKQEEKLKTVNENKNDETQLIQIQQELEEINPQVFKGVTPHKKTEIIKTLISVKMHSGPIPDPETLAQYDLVITDGANRIMNMAEKQQIHRMELERKAVFSQLKQSSIGQVFGFIVSLIIIGCGTFLIFNGHEKSGLILVTSTLVALASVFVLGKTNKKKSTQ